MGQTQLEKHAIDALIRLITADLNVVHAVDVLADDDIVCGARARVLDEAA